MNQGIKGQRPYRPPYGQWPLNSDPFFTRIRTSKVHETIHFLNLHDNLINLSPVSLKLDQFENLTLYKMLMTFFCFGLYLENETPYGFHVMDFFAPYDPRKNLTDMHYN